MQTKANRQELLTMGALAPRVGFCFIVAALAVLASSTSHSTKVARPARNVTAQDVLDHSVSTSDAIATGCVLRIEQTRIPVVGAPGAVTERYDVLISCLEWLKGFSEQDTIRVHYTPDRMSAQDVLQQGAAAESRFLIFLRRHPKLPMGVTLESAEDPSIDWEWSLRQSPYILGEGAVIISDGRGQDQVAGIRRTIASQSVESLASQADAVIVGDPMEWRRATSPQSPACRLYRVVDAVLSTSLPDTVCVYVVFAGTEPRGRSLLFLRQASDGSFEVLASAAGALEIRDGSIPAIGQSLDATKIMCQPVTDRAPRPSGL